MTIKKKIRPPSQILMTISEENAVVGEFDEGYQMIFTSMSIEAVHVEAPGEKSRTFCMPNVLGKT